MWSPVSARGCGQPVSACGCGQPVSACGCGQPVSASCVVTSECLWVWSPVSACGCGQPVSASWCGHQSIGVVVSVVLVTLRHGCLPGCSKT